MGRLFWKFFLLICLVQTVSVLAVAVSFSLREDERHAREHRPPPPPPDCTADDPARCAPPPGPSTEHAPGPGPGGGFERGPGGPDGPRAGDEPAREHRRFVIPPEPIVGGLFASIAAAGLLAWFLSKPIRSLRGAFEAAAQGDLKVRIRDRMGRGDDEIKDLGRDFDRMVERLDALMLGQRRLLHDVSHEMRSPLARIQAAIGLAHQQPGQCETALLRIERESSRMDKLIGEILAIARLQAGFSGTMDEDIDMGELMAAIVDDASFEARTKGRSVVVEAQADAPVRGNVELLRRAIENVIRNAIKYSYEGGQVRIATRLAEKRGRIVIAVRDAGPGVPEPDLQAIFEPFFRSLAGAQQEGHGLGLAIAKRVVDAHGGRISASNVTNGGLCVEIELPVSAA